MDGLTLWVILRFAQVGHLNCLRFFKFDVLFLFSVVFDIPTLVSLISDSCS